MRVRQSVVLLYLFKDTDGILDTIGETANVHGGSKINALITGTDPKR
jgi:hypothetical protein